MFNRDKPWFDDQCRHAFGFNQEAHLRWTRDCSWVNWVEFVRCQVRAIGYVYSFFYKRTADVMVNELISYTGDSTLMAVVPSIGVKVTVAESMIRDLGRVSEWCESE